MVTPLEETEPNILVAVTLSLQGAEHLLVKQVPRTIRRRHNDNLTVRALVHRRCNTRPHLLSIRPERQLISMQALIRPTTSLTLAASRHATKPSHRILVDQLA